jgi:hypothetical protein
MIDLRHRPRLTNGVDIRLNVRDRARGRTLRHDNLREAKSVDVIRLFVEAIRDLLSRNDEELSILSELGVERIDAVTCS